VPISKKRRRMRKSTATETKLSTKIAIENNNSVTRDRKERNEKENPNVNDVNDDDDNDNDDDDDEVFEVERVLDHKLKNGEKWYKLKFMGYNNRHNKWLPLYSLNCDELIEEYHKNNN
jgi:hypothetical protein